MIKLRVKTRDGAEEVDAYGAEECNFKPLKFHRLQRNRKSVYYAEEYACLDTETSHCGLKAWIYQWAVKFNGSYIIGRTPAEFIRLLERLRDTYRLREDKKIILYIHNAAYDIQYLKHYLKEYDNQIRILATDNHAVLICDIFGFRILCSYRLSNMSLDLFSRSYAHTYLKAVNEIDYSVVRYQDEELEDKDWYYMLSDVASQHDAIHGYLESQGYEYAFQSPFTSTGFVRADCRKAAQADKEWRKQFLKMQLSLEQYLLCRQAFMGGITIQSYKYADTIVKNVGHKDFTSSYPARQMMDYMPAGKPMWYGDIESMQELDRCLDKYCCVFLLSLDNVQIKPGITAPYIPSSKCLSLKGEVKVNGKIVYADHITIAVTEIDYKWIKRQYTADHIKASHMLIMERGEAPKWLKDSVMKYFRGKCTLKHSDPKLYMASKARLNGIYGMSATSIVRDNYDLDDNCIIVHKRSDDKEKQIRKYYASYNSFMPYQLGIYTTAHARDALMTMIEAVGYENFIYCDTDSVFYKKNKKSEAGLKVMNEKIKKRAIAAGAFVDNNILGYATDEAKVRAFKGLHSKCYALEEMNEKTGRYELHVTIAGIPKQAVKWINGEPVRKTNAEELGKLNNLTDGYTFSHCGGTRCIYVEDLPRTEDINGHMTELASAAIIEPIEKTISDTMYTLGKNYELLHITQHQVYE